MLLQNNCNGKEKEEDLHVWRDNVHTYSILCVSCSFMSFEQALQQRKITSLNSGILGVHLVIETVALYSITKCMVRHNEYIPY